MKIQLGKQQEWQADDQRWSQLMARAHGGDRPAYDELLHELAEVIEKYLLVRFGALDIVEDMVQECLLAVHRGRHTYHPKRPFRPWLFTVVRHRAIDVLRRHKVYRQYQDVHTVDDHEAAIDRSASIDLDLARILKGLSPDYREALTLTKYAGYSIDEAASWAGTTPAAMKVRVHRALNATRRQLALEDYGVGRV